MLHYRDLVTADEERSRPGPMPAGVGQNLLLALRFATELATMAVLALAAASAVFVVAAAALGLAGDVIAAVIYAVIAIGTAVLLRVVAPGS